jgi:hypothetical protein
MRSCAAAPTMPDGDDPYVAKAVASQLPRGQVKAITGEMRGFRARKGVSAA